MMQTAHIIQRTSTTNIFSKILFMLWAKNEEPGTPMMDMLADAYLWLKALHVISVIAWMAGIFYLPRLFVYHVEAGEDAIVATFEVMERRLLRAIMTPAMVSTWLFGLLLVLTPGIVDWSAAWPWLKAIGVVAMTGFHFWLSGQRKALIAGSCKVTSRGFRAMNEVPTLLMTLIVVSVIVKF